MKSRKIRSASLLLLALLQCAIAFADTDSIPVDLSYDSTKKEDVSNRPHKAPANIQLSLTASVNGGLLVFSESQSNDYYYMVVDANGVTVSEDYLYFDGQSTITVCLNLQASGTYTLFVWYRGHCFSGSFGM